MGLADRVNVGELLRPASRPVRGDQVAAGNEFRLQSSRRVNYGFNPALSCGVKINSGKISENVESLAGHLQSGKKCPVLGIPRGECLYA
jgi:hypothetical protein